MNKTTYIVVDEDGTPSYYPSGLSDKEARNFYNSGFTVIRITEHGDPAYFGYANISTGWYPIDRANSNTPASTNVS